MKLIHRSVAGGFAVGWIFSLLLFAAEPLRAQPSDVSWITDATALRLLKNAAANPNNAPDWESFPSAFRDEAISRKAEHLVAATGSLTLVSDRPDTKSPAFAKWADPLAYEGGVKEFAGVMRSPEVLANAGRVAAANRSLLKGISGSERATRDIAKQVEALDLTCVGLLREVQEQRAGLSRVSAAQRQKSEKRLRISEGFILKSLSAANALDQAHFDNLRMVPTRSVWTILNSFSAVFAISWRNPATGEYKFRGTGYYYQGRILTCAHLLTQKWDPGLKDFSRVFVHPVDANLEIFAKDVPLEVIPSECFIVPELDVASLKLKPGLEAQAALDRAAAVKIDYAAEGATPAIGAVHALAVIEEGEVWQAQWVPPGRIVFPNEIRLPRRVKPSVPLSCESVVRDDLVSRDADVRFARAMRLELFASGAGVVTERAFCDGLSRIGTRYVSYQPPFSFELRLPTASDNKLDAFSDDPDFRAKRLIPCIGTDLPTQGGASGAPVFMLNASAQPQLIGMNLGIIGAENSTPTAPSLDNCTRVVPFPRIYSKLKKLHPQ